MPLVYISLFNAFTIKNTSCRVSVRTMCQMRFYEGISMQTPLASNHVAESEFSTKAAASNTWAYRIICIKGHGWYGTSSRKIKWVMKIMKIFLSSKPCLKQLYLLTSIKITLANQQLKATFHSTHVDDTHLWCAHWDILERLHVCVRNRSPLLLPVCPQATCMKVFLRSTCQVSETSAKVFASVKSAL